jgi:hypothetical protein
MLIYTIIYVLGNILNDISIYYQTVNYLNTKNNIIVIIILTIIQLQYNKKILFSVLEKKYLLLLVVLLSMFSDQNITTNNNLSFVMWVGEASSNLNTNLLNGIMLIHPYILYTFYSCLLVISTIYLNNILLGKKIKKHKKKVLLLVDIRILYKCTFLIITAIMLGC